MPFKSKAQMRWAFATHQPFAKEWALKTKNAKNLPEHDAESAKEDKGEDERRETHARHHSRKHSEEQYRKAVHRGLSKRKKH